MQKTPYAGTQSVMRAIAILNLFSEDVPEWSLMELSKAAELNRTTTYRILSALESSGMVAYDAHSDHYRLGPTLIVMGARALSANPVRAVAHPHLNTLAQKTGEMASLEVLKDDMTLILDEIKGEKQRNISSSIGNLWPANATSTGKILLAYMDPEERRVVFESGLARLTNNTITDFELLNQQLDTARHDGYAIAIDELETELTEVAAPILSHRGTAVAAISVGGPTRRMKQSTLSQAISLVKETALIISQQIGYRNRI